MTPADFLIDNADLVATCAGPSPRAGVAQGDISAIAHGSVAARVATTVRTMPPPEAAISA